MGLTAYEGQITFSCGDSETTASGARGSRGLEGFVVNSVRILVIVLFTYSLSLAQRAPFNLQTSDTRFADCGPAAPVKGSSAQIKTLGAQADEALRRHDRAEAFRLDQQAAALGDAMSQRILGFMYMQGKGPGTGKDMNKAVACFTRAANQGDPKAKVELAKMYVLGLSPLHQDYQRAYQLADEVAKAGQPIAFCDVGRTLANMNPPDPRGAVQFFEAGIQRGEKQYCADGRAQVIARYSRPEDGNSSGDCRNPSPTSCPTVPYLAKCNCVQAREEWLASHGCKFRRRRERDLAIWGFTGGDCSINIDPSLHCGSESCP